MPTLPPSGRRLRPGLEMATGDDAADRPPLPASGAITRSPRRRILAAVLLAPALFVGLVTAGGGWPPTPAVAWTALVALTAAGGAATLATYLPAPGAGWRLELGCAPCAAVSALSVLAAAFLLQSAPHQWSMALTATVVVGLGLARRLPSAGATCGA